MSTYRGDSPEPPDDAVPGAGADREDTEPLGYWEQQEAERARHPTRPAPEPHGGPQAGPASYPPASYPPASYPPSAYSPLPTSASASAPGPYPAPPGAFYGQGPVAGPYGGYAPVRDHPQSTLAMVLGLVGLVGGFILCGLGLLAAPFAWGVGAHALKEIRASNGTIGGESQARAGMIMGIVGTIVLAVLVVLAIVAVVGLVVFSESTYTTGGSTV